MTASTAALPGERRAAPSMLDLVRLSRRSLLPPGGPELYRQVALLTGLREGDEVLDVACGSGWVLEHLVTQYGVHGQGVDHDPAVVELAEARARERGLAARLQFQQAVPDQLPYRDQIFDVVVGELGLTARAEPESAVRELVRVTKPGGAVVLLQLAWKTPLDSERKRVLAKHLGLRPLMLVEWKQLLLEAGVGSLHTEEWSDEESAFHASVRTPFPNFAELFTVPEKLGILRRAWNRWGWRGVRSLLAREREIHQLLTEGRLLALDLVKGIRSALPGRETGAGEPALEGSAGQSPAPLGLALSALEGSVGGATAGGEPALEGSLGGASAEGEPALERPAGVAPAESALALSPPRSRGTP